MNIFDAFKDGNSLIKWLNRESLSEQCHFALEYTMALKLHNKK